MVSGLSAVKNSVVFLGNGHHFTNEGTPAVFIIAMFHCFATYHTNTPADYFIASFAFHDSLLMPKGQVL